MSHFYLIFITFPDVWDDEKRKFVMTKQCQFNQPISGQCSISIPLKTKQNQMFFWCFQGYRNRTVAWNRWKSNISSNQVIKNYVEKFFMSLCSAIRYTWCVSRFDTICLIKKCEKHPWRSVTFRACNYTKSNTPPCVFFTFCKLWKCYEIAQKISWVNTHMTSTLGGGGGGGG